MILANDDRPQTMHAEAEHTDRELLPDIVGRLLARHDARRAARRQTWRRHTAAHRAFYQRYQRLTADIGCATDRATERGYGLELYEPSAARRSTALSVPLSLGTGLSAVDD
jgi:hypothetical protein